MSVQLQSDKRLIFERLAAFAQASISHQAIAESADDAAQFWDGVVYRIQDYALTSDIGLVDEIITLPALSPVPGAKAWLMGLANIRGNLTSVVDLSGFLFKQRAPITAKSRLLITRVRNFPLALLVDEVLGQRHFAPSQQHEPQVSYAGKLENYITTAFTIGESSWSVFDLAKLVNAPEFLDAGAE